jgi:uncharacterized membrane protein YphA (DoxX/SURF4 family)
MRLPRVPFVDSQTALAIVRLTIGCMFISVFFENLGKGLYTAAGYRNLIEVYIRKGHSPGGWKSIMTVVARNASVMAPVQACSEISFGVLLALGLFSRVAAFGAFALLLGLWVSEWGTAWIWELLVPAMACLALALGRPGRKWGLDALLARRYPDGSLW